MPEYLGQWLWRGLKEDSEVYVWFSTLTPDVQYQMHLHVNNYVDILKQDYLGDQWQVLMDDVFEVQRFWQRGYEGKSPQAFITRQTMYTHMLTQVNDGGLQEINIVMRKAPIAWWPILNMSIIFDSRQLLARTIEHSKALIAASRTESTSRISASELLPVLRLMGIEPPHKPRFSTPG